MAAILPQELLHPKFHLRCLSAGHVEGINEENDL